MLTLTHRYRIYPDATQEQMLVEWMEICRGAFNYALREIKDWCDSRKCPIDRCSFSQNIRNRGIQLISTAGHAGMETACAADLPGADESQSRQVAKPRKGKTRKSKS